MLASYESCEIFWKTSNLKDSYSSILGYRTKSSRIGMSKVIYTRKALHSINIYEVLTIHTVTILLAQTFSLNIVTNNSRHV